MLGGEIVKEIWRKLGKIISKNDYISLNIDVKFSWIKIFKKIKRWILWYTTCINRFQCVHASNLAETLECSLSFLCVCNCHNPRTSKISSWKIFFSKATLNHYCNRPMEQLIQSTHAVTAIDFMGIWKPAVTWCLRDLEWITWTLCSSQPEHRGFQSLFVSFAKNQDFSLHNL